METQLTPYEAVNICEGLSEASENERIAAWQYLIDTGLCWQLQGYFGRTAKSLLLAGVCSPPAEKKGLVA